MEKRIWYISAVFTVIWYCFGMRSAFPRPLRPRDHEHLRINLSELPMKCIKSIFSFTTPRDVCRLAAVSKLFRSAANSDSVWKKFIPTQFYQIQSSDVTFSLCSSKRELYFRLCDSILIDGGTKRFWLERSTGKIGYTLSARAIWICLVDDPRYWRWVSLKFFQDDSRLRFIHSHSLEEQQRFWLDRSTGKIRYTLSASAMWTCLIDDRRYWRRVFPKFFQDDSRLRFDSVVKLEKVCWLEIKGALDSRLLSPDTEYSVVFRLRFTEDSHGWTGQTVNFAVTTPDGEDINSEHLLGEREGVASNGWTEVVAGEFTVRAAQDFQHNSSFDMSFRMFDLTSWWKGGLLIAGVKIEPCNSSSTEDSRKFISRPPENEHGEKYVKNLPKLPKEFLKDIHEEKYVKNLPKLPKKCIKAILSFTTPRDLCRLAAVSRLFRSAANSDSVWNKFVPPQCYQIQPSSVTFDLFSSKRKLYFCLCNSIPIKEERKRFWLERSTGKIGYMLSARELKITWGYDQSCWRWISRDDSRFGELAELLSVYCLDVGGGIECRLLSPNTQYRVVFLLKFRERSFGWNAWPIKFSVQTPGEGEKEFEYLLGQVETSGGWMEVVAGKFTVREEDDFSHIRFRMKETESNQSKSGLLIDGVKIEPCWST